jgi:hypothetical protein
MVGKAGTAFARRLTPALSTYANRRVFLPNAPVARSVGFRQRCRGPAGGRRAVVHGGSRDVGPRLKLTIDGSDLGVTNPARSRPLRQQLQVRVDPRGEPTVPRRVTACANKHNKPHGLIVGSRGRLSKPTTAAQPWPGELVFMPRSGHPGHHTPVRKAAFPRPHASPFRTNNGGLLASSGSRHGRQFVSEPRGARP